MPYNKAMTQEQLEQLGLSPSQAKAYLLLVKEGKLTPAQLMAKTGESRTNAYMVLDRLSDIGLAIKDEVKSCCTAPEVRWRCKNWPKKRGSGHMVPK
jgi:predicted transcriptional regulator